MNIRQLLQSDDYSDKHVLKLVLQDIFYFSKEQLYINWDKEISKDNFNKIKNIYTKYKQENIPIEYLLWYTFFMWEKFIVNEDTLISRPETEYLVNYALEEIKENTIVFDIWTWSGIIWINIAKYTDKLVVCSDISKSALEIAKKNKENILGDKKNIIFLESNLLDFVNNGDLRNNWKLIIDNWKGDVEINGDLGNNGNFETSSEWANINLGWQKKTYIICANLPYVEEGFQLDEYAKKEPLNALFAGKDGLDSYRKLLDQVIEMKNRRIILFFELMTKQAEALISEYNDLSFKILDTFHKNIKILKVIVKI